MRNVSIIILLLFLNSPSHALVARPASTDVSMDAEGNGISYATAGFPDDHPILAMAYESSDEAVDSPAPDVFTYTWPDTAPKSQYWTKRLRRIATPR